MPEAHGPSPVSVAHLAAIAKERTCASHFLETCMLPESQCVDGVQLIWSDRYCSES